MKININVSRKFKINGKEYNSIEEMPDDVRETFEKAMASKSGPDHQLNSATVRTTRINFNGKEYQHIDSMPPDVRNVYEKVMKAAESGALPDIDFTEGGSGMHRGSDTLTTGRPGDVRRPTKTEPSFSPRTFIVGFFIAALVLLLYYLFQNR